MSVISTLISSGAMVMSTDLVKQRMLKTRGPPTAHLPARGTYVRISYPPSKRNVPHQFSNSIGLVSSTLDDGYCNAVASDAAGTPGEVDLDRMDRTPIDESEVPDDKKAQLMLIDEEFFQKLIQLALAPKLAASRPDAHYRCGTIVVRVQDTVSPPVIGIVMYSDRRHCVTVAWLDRIIWYRRQLSEGLRRAAQFDVPPLGSRECDRLVRCYGFITGAMLRYNTEHDIGRRYESFIAPFQFVEIRFDSTATATTDDYSQYDEQQLPPENEMQ